ncbi:MAG: right-handed parallel beta-helix repeat-containing protein [Dehalococcoidia bacterium]
MKNFMGGSVLLLLIACSNSATPNSVVAVDCNQGDSIGTALEQASPGDTLRVRGTCRESITIVTDRITLEGQDNAVLDAGDDTLNVLTVDGARGVKISGLTIQNGRLGILGINAASLNVADTVVQDNGSHGVELLGVFAEFTNLTSRRNGRTGIIGARNSVVMLTDSVLEDNLIGLVVFSNSTARLFGQHVMERNATQGLTLGLGGSIFAIGSEVLANNNGSEGVFLIQGGNFQLTGGKLEANGNGTDGIRLLQSSTLRLGIEEFEVPGEATALGNTGHGFSATSGSDLAVSGSTQLTSRDNGQAGLWLDGGSRATITGAVIENNRAADVDLKFGSQATLGESTLGTVVCDDTVLLRGDTLCP